ELTSRMPSTDMTACSTISTTSVSMTSGAAPVQVKFTETTGNSTSGNWLTPMLLKPMMPKTIRAVMNIQANKERLMDRSESVIDISGCDFQGPIIALCLIFNGNIRAAHGLKIFQRLQHIQIIDQTVAVIRLLQIIILLRGIRCLLVGLCLLLVFADFCVRIAY